MPQLNTPGSNGVGLPARQASFHVSDRLGSPLTPFERFLLWERSSRDTIEVKRAYIDMAGDLVAGIMLSQIVYWHLPDRDGNTRLRIEHDGVRWIARARTEWWDECRITPKQADRALDTLRKAGIIETRLYRFHGAPTVHVRIIEDRFMQAWQAAAEGESDHSDRSEPSRTPDFPQRSKTISPSGENPSSPEGKNDLPETVKSITETTTKSTAETTTTAPVVVAHQLQPGKATQPAPPPSMKERLIQAGVTEEVATRICKNCGEAVISQQLAMLPYREARDPAAVLVKAIAEQWAPPAAYIRAEERRMREDRLREDIERRKREEEREQYALETRKAIQDDYWDSLDQRARTGIEREVERRFAERYPGLALPGITHKSGRIMRLMKDELRRQILDERMDQAENNAAENA